MSTITCIGLCGQSVFLTLDHFHDEGETVHADSIYSEPGGKGYNQCVAAKRLGADVNFIGCCGDDSDGKICRAFLLNEGVNPYIEVSETSNTAYASILTDKSGRNRVTVYRGASDDLSVEFIRNNEKVIADSDILLLNLEISDAVNLTAAEIAYRNGVKIILNPAPAKKIPKQLIEKCYIIVPNESENNNPDCDCENKVVTLGDKGADVITDGIVTHIDAVKTKAVDTTGAGDCFCGALAVAITEGKNIREAAEFAVICSGYSVSKKYVMPSLPRRDQI